MTIDFTKEQYQDLLTMAVIANSVYGILGDSLPDEYKQEANRLEALQDYLLGFADKFGCGHLVEKFHGKLIPSDDFSEKIQAVMDAYDDDSFWNELETRLGKRDFERSISDAERKEMDGSDWYPNRIHEIYERWAKEFENHGIERLEIKIDQNSSETNGTA